MSILGWRLRAATVALLVMSTIACAAEGTKEERGHREGFKDALAKRADLLDKITRLERESAELDALRREADTLQHEKTRIDQNTATITRTIQLLEDRLRAAPNERERSELKKQLAAEQKALEGTPEMLPANKRLIEVAPSKDTFAAKKKDLDDARSERTKLETFINDELNIEKPRQVFKQNISTLFSVLVGLVILGFFAVAFYDANVRQAMFAGTAGIQFVTLFSLVIAIILFGLTEILEGKELAALLGGLSGYILGRATSELRPTEADGARAPRASVGRQAENQADRGSQQPER